MRKVALLLVVLSVMSVGCAPLYGGYGRSYARTAPVAPSSMDVVGRWDNVMMLPPRARVHVLLLNGSRAEGDILLASATTLKLAVAAGEMDIAAENVARVDRAAASDGLTRGLRGALHGAGTVGVLALLTGRGLPARQYAAGAIVGADVGFHSGAAAGNHTVYIAPQVRR